MIFDLRDVAKVFESVDWIVPPYIQIGHLRKLATVIDQVPQADKHRLLEEGLVRLYGPDDFAVMLLERYQKVPHVLDFKRPIAEAIEAAQIGLYHAAVTTLLPVLEGIIRKLAAARGQTIGQGTSKLANEIDAMIARETFQERVVMLEAFRDFFKKKLLVNTAAFQGPTELNRHGILHGVFSDYGSDGNFCKMISLLDFLTFFISLTTPCVSMFAPDVTEASQKLADYYRTLGRIRPAAAVAGARV